MDIGIIFTKILAFATLIGNIFALSVLISHWLLKSQFRKLISCLSDQALPIGFFLSASATLGSIFYAIVVGYPACILCWTQRIFMYPMMFLFGLALFRKEKNILPYAFLLTLLGGAVSLYHWVKDMLALYGGVTIPCPAVSSLPSCDKIYVLEYGYITIPMIALSAFVLIGIVLWSGMRESRHD